MIRRVFVLSLAFLTAGGASSAADLTEQYRATADKLIDAALADTEGYALADMPERLVATAGRRGSQ